MRQITFSWIIALLLITEVSAKTTGASPVMPSVFVQNLGQWPEDVLFRADAGMATIWICKERIVYQFTHRLGSDSVKTRPRTRPFAAADSAEQLVVSARFVGSTPGTEAVGEGLLGARCNYFLGDDPSKWRTDVPGFREVAIKNLYPGIDLHFHSKDQGGVFYEFVTATGADPGQVEVAYEGIEGVTCGAGGWSLASTFSGESNSLVLSAEDLVRYVVGDQVADNGEASGKVVSRSALQSAGVGDVVLDYSTFLGGSGDESGAAIAVDKNGCAYVTGTTSSSDFPTENGYSTGFGGASDLFVVKLSASGDALVYATYLGGSASDYGMSLAVDSTGCAYITGFTMSNDFPVLAGYDMTRNDLYYTDVIVTKLSSSGNSLVYSTYLGGTADEYGSGIAVDESLCAYVTGNTGSSDFPTVNGYDSDYNGGYDCFVTKLSSTGSALAYSTFLGGTGSDDCYDIAVDHLGCAYVTGGTGSSGFPMLNAYDAGLGGNYDAFVTKLSSSGGALAYSTYLGGAGNDCGESVAVDSLGCAYLTGYTPSADFPIVNGFDSHYDGKLDAFVTKVSSAGNTLVYSTFLGGSNDGLGGQGMDEGYDIAVDKAGCAYITGYSSCSDFPLKAPYDAFCDGTDAFVTQLAPSGDSLILSTYLGQLYVDAGYAIAVDSAGRAYVTGETGYELFPVTSGSYDVSYNGGSDGFVTKLGVRLGCCIDRVGDANSSGDDEPTIGDVSVLIDAKFITGTCEGKISCLAEADVNQSGDADPDCNDITIGDISSLIDYLFITGSSLGLPDCL
jgi:hypothetical protein